MNGPVQTMEICQHPLFLKQTAPRDGEPYKKERRKTGVDSRAISEKRSRPGVNLLSVFGRGGDEGFYSSLTMVKGSSEGFFLGSDVEQDQKNSEIDFRHCMATREDAHDAPESLFQVSV